MDCKLIINIIGLGLSQNVAAHEFWPFKYRQVNIRWTGTYEQPHEKYCPLVQGVVDLLWCFAANVILLYRKNTNWGTSRYLSNNHKTLKIYCHNNKSSMSFKLKYERDAVMLERMIWQTYIRLPRLR